ncbi:ion channel [Thalassotalea sp. PLHSN55]|uniref:ion channel n=1 Tax=Thalassotalea sp. PLHSN55 TaxID=3435888 RepID=UPI003F831F11
MSEQTKNCKYQDPDGATCLEQSNASGFCYWHDKTVDKSSSSVKVALETYAKKGGLLRGIILQRANLSGIDLVNHGSKTGYDFSYADFYRADLSNGHLFNINLSGASLMKANLANANLNCATLEKTNLLGAKWTQTKIENIQFGKKLKQEDQAKQALRDHDHASAIDYFEQAEEIYRDLRKHAEREGIFSLAGQFIHRELTMRRMQLPPLSLKRLTSKIIDLFCGYGENPVRIILLSIILIIICAVLYALSGLNYQDQLYVMSFEKSVAENCHIFLSCLYYSVVTFTTLGYGDFTPIGFSRAIAAMEAFTGSFTIALFVVVFVKKMTR